MQYAVICPCPLVPMTCSACGSQVPRPLVKPCTLPQLVGGCDQLLVRPVSVKPFLSSNVEYTKRYNDPNFLVIYCFLLTCIACISLVPGV